MQRHFPKLLKYVPDPFEDLKSVIDAELEDDGLLITLTCKTRQCRLPLKLLSGLDGRQRVLDALPRHSPVIFDLRNVLTLEPAQRLALVDLMVACPAARAYFGEQEFEDLFKLAVQTIPDHDHEELETLATAKTFAIQVAVLRCPHALEGACQRIATRLREQGWYGVRLASLVKEAERIRQDTRRTNEGFGDRHVKRSFSSSPCNEELVIPLRWIVDVEGVRRTANDQASIPAPVLITARFKEYGSASEWTEVGWFRAEKWTTCVVERRVIADSRKLLELADKGFPVTSSNAKN